MKRIALSLSAIVACADGDAALDAARGQYLERSCEAMFACPVSDRDWDVSIGQLGDLEGCRQLMASRPTPILAALLADVRAGHLDFDGAAFEACLDDYFRDCSSADCSGSVCVDPSCRFPRY